MDDLISRQAAKVSITRYFEVHVRNQKSRRLKEHAEEICRDICFGIDAWPSVQPETQWIPCSEETGDGYPEEDGLYYVTEQNYGFYLDAECKQRVTHTSHFKNGDFTDRFYTENNSNITAWMPLPEPYKEEKS